MEEVIKAYKGFKRDMTCRGFQYEEGKEYEIDEAKACDKGFHACEYPLDVFEYYAPGESVYHEVEQFGNLDKSEGDKVASTKIKIGTRLDIAGIVKAAIEYVKERCTNRYNAKHGEPATAGDSGAATAGDSGAATAGDSGAATAGSYGAATAGDSGAATAGDSGAATAGSYGAATSRGKSATGENGLSVARGNDVRVKGGLGAILVIAEEGSYTYDIKNWLAVVVDGVNVKADTWYKLNEDGKLVEYVEE